MTTVPGQLGKDLKTQNKPGNIESIKVFCRFRPFNEKFEPISSQCVEFQGDQQVNFTGLDSTKTFMFDRVFQCDTSQETVFDVSARHVLTQFLAGCNGTIFCYGQTGAGKSYTMTGPSIDSFTDKGLMPRVFNYLFDQLSAESQQEIFTHSVSCSFFEIYMERIRDLLADESAPQSPAAPLNQPSFVLPSSISYGGNINANLPIGPSNLQIRESKERGVYVENLTTYRVYSAADLLQYLKKGNTNRITAATNMNDTSSRSHSVLNISLETEDKLSGAKRKSQLYLIDLAGSEKASKTGAEGIRLDEARLINLSLSTLGNVISALSEGKSKHVPYRDSKLTRILQDSLGGTSSTSLIICCSPSKYNEIETLSTLRFGERAKNVKNKIAMNQEFGMKQLKAMLEKANAEIARLNSVIANMVEASHMVTESIMEHSVLEKSTVGDGMSSVAGMLMSKTTALPFTNDETPKKDDSAGEKSGFSSYEAKAAAEITHANELNRIILTMTSLDELRNIIIETNQKYVKTLGESLQAINQMYVVREERNSLRSEIKEQVAEIDHLKEVISDAKAEVDIGEQKYNELRAQYDSLAISLESIKIEKDDILRKLRVSEEKCKALGEAVETANASIAEATLSMIQTTPSIVVSSPRLSLPYQIGGMNGTDVATTTTTATATATGVESNSNTHTEPANTKSALKSARTRLAQHNSVVFDDTVFFPGEDSISLGESCTSLDTLYELKNILTKDTISDADKIRYYPVLKSEFINKQVQVQKLVKALASNAFTIVEAELQAATMEERISVLCNNAKIVKQYKHLDKTVKLQAADLLRMAEKVAELEIDHKLAAAEIAELRTNNSYLLDQLTNTRTSVNRIVKYKDDIINILRGKMEAQSNILDGLSENPSVAGNKVSLYSITRGGTILANGELFTKLKEGDHDSGFGFIDCNGQYTIAQGLQYFKTLPYSNDGPELSLPEIHGLSVLLPNEMKPILTVGSSKFANPSLICRKGRYSSK